MTNMSASSVAARRMREARQRKRWTVSNLAEACAKAGVPRLTAPVITNLETRRKPGREINAEELLALAWVLEVPPVQLLSPLSGDEALEVVPGETKDPIDGAAWLSDEDSSIGPVRLAASTRPEETERVLRYRDSPLAVIRSLRAASRAILFHDRLLVTVPGKDGGWYQDEAHRQESMTTLGVRLLHLFASLEALGYSPPPMNDVMGVLAKYGIPATLAEWELKQAEGEVPDGEGA
jgi:transcriptional regulator with XRE-family HTH domain